ncbi:MAG: HAD family hydrolase [Clostridiales bacterium]|nr:HAD family hydrolase [Clostridiales bacterium]
MDALIFDVDGTLWDSRQVVADAWNQVVLEELGYRPGYDRENISYLFGKTMTAIADSLFPQLPPEERYRIARRCFRDENAALEKTPGDFYPGVLETIPRLAERLPLYILSNCQAGYIDIMVGHTGLARCFSGWMCFDDTGLPKGENLKLLVTRHGLRSPVYVGDTQGDWEACQQAGVPMIFAAYGLGTVDAAIPAIQRFDQLTELVDGNVL